MSTVADIYRGILDLFQDEKKFAQGYYCYNAGGKPCEIAKGNSFCVLGAMWLVSERLKNESVAAQCLLQRVSEHLYDGVYIQIINDEIGGYEKVKAALQFAINLWDGYEPTDEDYSLSVTDLLKKRANVQ